MKKIVKKSAKNQRKFEKLSENLKNRPNLIKNRDFELGLAGQARSAKIGQNPRCQARWVLSQRHIVGGRFATQKTG